jgi:hypothetical protein
MNTKTETDYCICCCRPLSQHNAKGQCPEPSYFISNSMTRPSETIRTALSVPLGEGVGSDMPERTSSAAARQHAPEAVAEVIMKASDCGYSYTVKGERVLCCDQRLDGVKDGYGKPALEKPEDCHCLNAAKAVISAFGEDLRAKQQPMPAQIEKAFWDHHEEMYVRLDASGASASEPAPPAEPVTSEPPSPINTGEVVALLKCAEEAFSEARYLRSDGVYEISQRAMADGTYAVSRARRDLEMSDRPTVLRPTPAGKDE